MQVHNVLYMYLNSNKLYVQSAVFFMVFLCIKV